MKYKLNKGFTLIELLVVISIIGVLSSVVLSSLATAREKAKVSKIQQEINQLNLAFEIYYNEFGGYPFDGTDGAGGQYCISFDAAVECYRDGIEITARLEDMNATITSFYKGIQQYNSMVAAAVEFPEYREFVSFGSGTGSSGTLTQGYVYQECDAGYTQDVEVDGVAYEVCTINETTGETNGPFLTYPNSSNGNVTIKGRVLGVPGEVDVDDGGTI